jgi:hypothetical protein
VKVIRVCVSAFPPLNWPSNCNNLDTGLGRRPLGGRCFRAVLLDSYFQVVILWLFMRWQRHGFMMRGFVDKVSLPLPFLLIL